MWSIMTKLSLKQSLTSGAAFGKKNGIAKLILNHFQNLPVIRVSKKKVVNA